MALTQSDIHSIVKQWLREIGRDGDWALDLLAGKREELRYFPWAGRLEVRFENDHLLARGENLSRQGICFVCKREIPSGTIVEIRRPDEEPWIPVRVQHATQTVGGFKIGGRFLAD